MVNFEFVWGGSLVNNYKKILLYIFFSLISFNSLLPMQVEEKSIDIEEVQKNVNEILKTYDNNYIQDLLEKYDSSYVNEIINAEAILVLQLAEFLQEPWEVIIA